MALMPKNVKFRKTQRGKFKGLVNAEPPWSTVSTESKPLEAGWITSQQIESARVVARHFVGNSVVYTFVSSHTATSPHVQLKPVWVKVKVCPTNGFATSVPGMILFELKGVSESIAREAFRRQAHKLPVKNQIRSEESGYANFRD